MEQHRLQSHGKNDRGTKEGGKPDRGSESARGWAWGERDRKGTRGEASGPKHDQRSHLPMWRNVKPLILSANVQNEVQTIHFVCCLLLKRCCGSLFLSYKFSMKDTTELLTELSENCVNMEKNKNKTSFVLRDEKTRNCFRVTSKL